MMSVQNIRESRGIYYAQKMFLYFEGEMNNLKLYFVLRVAHVGFLQSESSDANVKQSKNIFWIIQLRWLYFFLIYGEHMKAFIFLKICSCLVFDIEVFK
jgi:hypothetical protein